MIISATLPYLIIRALQRNGTPGHRDRWSAGQVGEQGGAGQKWSMWVQQGGRWDQQGDRCSNGGKSKQQGCRRSEEGQVRVTEGQVVRRGQVGAAGKVGGKQSIRWVKQGEQVFRRESG